MNFSFFFSKTIVITPFSELNTKTDLHIFVFKDYNEA